MTDVRAVTATVGGRVHGVGFRYSTQRTAAGLGLSGWVRNMPDGTVLLWAQGPADAVERLCKFLEEGPPVARVTSLEISEAEPDADITGFNVRF